jgi:DNA helicase-2/ATP-dependent DNA helicase PcrA
MTRRAQRIVAAVLDEKAGVGDTRGMGPGPAVKLPWSGTFHSIANRLIRRHCATVGLDASFSVLDRGDAADLMDVLRHELGFSKSDKRFPRKDTCLAIYSHRVNAQDSLAATLTSVFPWCAEWEQELTRLYRAYVDRKLAHQALDYDDLLLYWHAMVQDAALAEQIGAQFEQILVDEYQDTMRCRRRSFRRCGLRVRASPWWGTMRSRSTRFAPRPSRTYSAFRRATDRRRTCSPSKRTIARRKAC